MKIAVFGTKNYDRTSFEIANAAFGHELEYLEPHLSPETCVLARQVPAICAFVNDRLDRDVLRKWVPLEAVNSLHFLRIHASLLSFGE
jgi:D-lactate dehydrogenase